MVVAGERAGLDDDSPLMSMLGRSSRTQTLQKARSQGHIPTLNAATGLSESSVEATGYDMLINRVSPAAQQILIKGEKGSGKTVLGTDIVRRLYADFDGELSIATNIRGPHEHDAVTFVETMSALLEWVRDTEGEKIALMDEWSTTMNAHAHPGGEIRQTVSRFVNALRKGSGGSTRLLIIGHQHDTDIASILRTQSDVVVEKAGKADEGLADQAAVYPGWEGYIRGEPDFKIRGLQDVPENSVWGADTNYFAYFEPDLDNPREQIKRGQLVENWEEFQETDDPEKESGEERRVCRGERTDGEPCKQTTTHESGYCMPHRDQWDEEGESGEDDLTNEEIEDNLREFLEVHGTDGMRELIDREYRDITGDAPADETVDEALEDAEQAVSAVVDGGDPGEKGFEFLAGAILDVHDDVGVQGARELARELTEGGD